MKSGVNVWKRKFDRGCPLALLWVMASPYKTFFVITIASISPFMEGDHFYVRQSDGPYFPLVNKALYDLERFSRILNGPFYEDPDQLAELEITAVTSAADPETRSGAKLGA